MKCSYDRCPLPSEPLMCFDWGDYHESCLDRLTEDEQAEWGFLVSPLSDREAYEWGSSKWLSVMA